MHMEEPLFIHLTNVHLKLCTDIKKDLSSTCNTLLGLLGQLTDGLAAQALLLGVANECAAQRIQQAHSTICEIISACCPTWLDLHKRVVTTSPLYVHMIC